MEVWEHMPRLSCRQYLQTFWRANYLQSYWNVYEVFLCVCAWLWFDAETRFLLIQDSAASAVAQALDSTAQHSANANTSTAPVRVEFVDLDHVSYHKNGADDWIAALFVLVCLHCECFSVLDLCRNPIVQTA